MMAAVITDRLVLFIYMIILSKDAGLSIMTVRRLIFACYQILFLILTFLIDNSSCSRK